MNRIQKPEKRISTQDLISYIKSNIEIINSIGCIDLDNDTNDEIKASHHLDQLKFQDVQRITFLPPNLAKFFDISQIKYLHAGVLKHCSEKKGADITLYSSVISCLKQSFLSQPTSDQDALISRFIARFKSESKGLYDKLGYKKFKWTRNSLGDDIESNTLGKNVVKYLADYFHINLFILDVSNDVIYFANGTLLVPYKKNIFLLRYEDGTFEPFFTEHNRFVVHSDKLMRKLIDNLDMIYPFNFSDEPDASVKVKIEEEQLSQYGLKITESMIRIVKGGEFNDLLGGSKPEVKPVVKPVEEYDENMNRFDEDSDSSFESEEEKPQKINKTKQNGIWVKKHSDDKVKENVKKVVTSSESKTSPKASMSMTLPVLQKLAEKYKLPISTTKNGKIINKTKSELCAAINKVKK
jgi:hypothetical protein